MTSYAFEIPEEYSGWREITREEYEGARVGDRAVAIHVSLAGWDDQGKVPSVTVLKSVYLAPPRPKLPDVGGGGVIWYTNVVGMARRAVKSGGPYWHIFGSTGHICGFRDEELLRDVDDAGFFVELRGLT